MLVAKQTNKQTNSNLSNSCWHTWLRHEQAAQWPSIVLQSHTARQNKVNSNHVGTCSVTILLCWSASRLTGWTVLSFLPSAGGLSSLTCRWSIFYSFSSSPYDGQVFFTNLTEYSCFSVWNFWTASVFSCCRILSLFLLSKSIGRKTFWSWTMMNMNTTSPELFWKTPSYLLAGSLEGQCERHHHLDCLQKPSSSWAIMKNRDIYW